MEDEIDKGNQEQDKENISKSESSVSESIAKVNDKIEDSASKQESTQPPKDNKTDKRVSLYKRLKAGWHDNHQSISVVSNIIMALGAIAAVFISYKSLDTSNESLRLTRESIAGSGAKDSAIIAIAKSTSEATRLNAEATRENVDINKTYTQLFKNATEIGNRSYIVADLDGIKLEEFGAGKKIKISALLKNVGKTPAQNIKALVTWCIHTSEEAANVDKAFWYEVNEKIKYVTANATLGNGDHTTCFNREAMLPLTSRQDSLFTSNYLKLYIAVTVTYADIFGHSHYTHVFCEKRRFEKRYCEKYNDAN